MTILYSVYAPEGIVFSADTMLTRTKKSRTEYVEASRPKVFRIPKAGEHSRGALVGYYGLAEIGGRPMPEFLDEFRGAWAGDRSIRRLADRLIEELVKADKAHHLRHHVFGLHVGGFELFKDRICPAFYYVRNAEADEGTGLYHLFPDRQLHIDEQLMGRTLMQWDAHEARRALLHWQRQNGIPLWFRNGDLATMAGPTASIELAARYLAARPMYRWPRSLSKWEALIEVMVDTTAELVRSMYTRGTPTIGGHAVSEALAWPGV
jgi:hypothetical protein